MLNAVQPHIQRPTRCPNGTTINSNPRHHIERCKYLRLVGVSPERIRSYGTPLRSHRLEQRFI